MKIKAKKPKITPEMKAAVKAQKDAKPPKELIEALTKPKKKKCFWPWDHDWENWKIIEQGKIENIRTYYYLDKTNTTDIGNYKVQQRTCINCGKTQLETLRTTIYD